MILDIEASSLHHTDSFPVEIAWGTDAGNIRSFLVNLSSVLDRLDWSEESERIHEISLNECLSQGEDPSVIVEAFLADLGDEPPYSDGPDYDYFWLSQLFRMAGIDMPFGQLIPATDLFSKALRHNGFGRKNAFEVAQQIMDDEVGAMRMHRASEDVQALFMGLEIARRTKPEAKIVVEDYRHKGFEKVRQDSSFDY